MKVPIEERSFEMWRQPNVPTSVPPSIFAFERVCSSCGCRMGIDEMPSRNDGLCDHRKNKNVLPVDYLWDELRTGSE